MHTRPHTRVLFLMIRRTPRYTLFPSTTLSRSHTHTHPYTHTHRQTYTRKHTNIHSHKHTHTHTSTHADTHTHTNTYTNKQTDKYTHTQTQTPTSPCRASALHVDLLSLSWLRRVELWSCHTPITCPWPEAPPLHLAPPRLTAAAGPPGVGGGGSHCGANAWDICMLPLKTKHTHTHTLV